MRYLTAFLLGPLFAVGLNVTAPHADAAVPAYRVYVTGHHDCRTTMPTTGTARLRCGDGYSRDLRPCPEEDSSYCYWNARVRGVGGGHSFVAITHTHWTWGVWSPR